VLVTGAEDVTAFSAPDISESRLEKRPVPKPPPSSAASNGDKRLAGRLLNAVLILFEATSDIVLIFLRQCG